MSLAARVAALEKNAAADLPRYNVVYYNGERRQLDAVQLWINIAEAKAGKDGAAAMIQEAHPENPAQVLSGGIWKDLAGILKAL